MYSIVFAQLAITMCVSAAFVRVGLQSYVAANSWLLIVSFLLALLVLVLLFVYRRQVPHNYILLVIFVRVQLSIKIHRHKNNLQCNLV